MNTFCCFYDSTELIGYQTGVADEEAVDALDFEVAGGSARIDGAAIEDGNIGASGVTVEFGDVFTDKDGDVGDIVGFGGFGVFVTTDSPDGFVGDDNFINIFFAEVGQAAVELIINNRAGFAVFVFGGSFAKTEDWGEAAPNSGGDFGADIFIGFMKKVAAFGVTDESIVNKAAKLRNRGFAGVSAEVAPIKVLGGEFELATIELQREGLQRDGGGGEDDFDVATGLNAVCETVEVKAGFAWCEIHFPVGDDISFARTCHGSILA